MENRNEIKAKLIALLNSGTSEFKAKQELLDDGYQRSEIDAVFDEAVNEFKTSKNNNANLFIIGGLVILLGSLAISFYSYVSARPGESYSIYVKPIILGAIGMIWGLVKRFS